MQESVVAKHTSIDSVKASAPMPQQRIQLFKSNNRFLKRPECPFARA